MARDFNLSGRVVTTLKRIGRPATASEVRVNLCGARDVEPERVGRRLDDLVEAGVLTSFVREEPEHYRAAKRVERRYFSLSKGV